eukprot:scaffold45304_cov191-Amphora_coffeaeformis.AAC.1
MKFTSLALLALISSTATAADDRERVLMKYYKGKGDMKMMKRIMGKVGNTVTDCTKIWDLLLGFSYSSCLFLFNLSQGKGKGKGVYYEPKDVCKDSAEANQHALDILCTVPGATDLLDGMKLYLEEGITVGSTTALIAEANDAAVTHATIQDGESGDTNFPHGNLKPIVTVGERSVCPESQGKKATGVPDGMGAYLYDYTTVRTVWQSESYGPVSQQETYVPMRTSSKLRDTLSFVSQPAFLFLRYPYYVNDGKASFTGSHIHYVDYDREALSGFMHGDYPASDFVTGFGEMIEYAYNLKGEPIGPRNGSEPTLVGAHFGNTDAEGNYVSDGVPSEADWNMMSLCSAHLIQKYQWGDGIGTEDDMFMTNEEWNYWKADTLFVGLGAQVLDLQHKTLYAVGAMSQGGFEKIPEINSQHPDYVMFALSGYAADFVGANYPQAVIDARNAEYGPRSSDGGDYILPKFLNPFRFYVGVKGKMEDGTPAPHDDFLARNGLRYGQIYGFAVDRDAHTGGKWRDDFHKDPELAYNGAHVPGYWFAQAWRWDGTVKNYQHDASWEYQDIPPQATGEFANYEWWNGNGYSEGAKTEHSSPDPRPGITGFVQGSTAGYFGHLYVHDVLDYLDGDLPDHFPGSYYVYQGELDVTSQIELGGAGKYTEGRDATRNYDNVEGRPEGKLTFEDIDGLEVVEGPGHKLYAIIQEDSGNNLGERMFITQPLEHEDDGHELTYYFVAMSGGIKNSRVTAKVGIPKGTAEGCSANANEFSGIFDLSGLLYKEGKDFALMAGDDGHYKRSYDKEVPINEKDIMIGLQAHHLECGVILEFQADRGGQVLVYKPDIPEH